MLVGYILINPDEENSHRQLDSLIKIGVDMRKIYQDKIENGVNSKEKFVKMLSETQEGDIVIVTEIMRLGRSTAELLDAVEKIGRRGANIISLKEQWFNTTNANGAVIYDVLKGIAQFEQELDSKKIKTEPDINNIDEEAKLGGRPRKAQDKIQEAINLYNEKKLSTKEIQMVTGVSKATLYRYLKNGK